MAPQGSSFGVAFRALLMLGCLVAIPLAALSNSSLPKKVKELLGDRLPGGSGAGEKTDAAAPVFQPVPPTTSNPAAPLEQRIPLRSAEPLPAAPRWPGSAGEVNPSPVTPAAYQSPVEGAPLIRPAPLGGLMSPPPGEPPARDPLRLLPPDRPAPQPLPPLELSPPSDAAPATETANRDQQFTFYQERLRQQGATYFLLESWGSQQQLFRFFCKMAIGGNPNCTRHFEATHADPLQAMAQVVAEVEAWRAGRL